MRIFIAALLALCLTSAATAQVPASLPLGEVSFDATEAPAGRYELDPRHASLTWRVRHMGLGVYVGRFDACLASTSTCQRNGVSGAIAFNPQQPEASTLTMNVEIAALSTGLVSTDGERSFDTQITALLGLERTPQATFVSSGIVRTGPTTALITGDLTMNGQTHPVTFEATFQGGKSVALRGGKYVLAFSARTIIDRTLWGVESFIFNQFAANEVELHFEGEFVKA